MAPPFKGVEFEIVFGIGIDRMLEIMDMASEFGILRKYGKTITYKETKYDLDEFTQILIDHPEFFDSLKEEIINKLSNQETIKIEEHESTLQEIGAGSTEA
jgi:recombination protein RecA